MMAAWAGADPNAKDEQEWVALTNAIRNDNVEIAGF
jgi:hypothetical protein